MNKKTEPSDAAQDAPDEEMQAIGYPPPVDPGTFGRRLSEIIKRAMRSKQDRADKKP
ncbi:MAG TPA: hypothetical protein VH678_01400 [Xanthobacteraceae bacterium]|jgi:hypothetical protein